ncbi:MAG: hypothetical protein ACI902_000682 [Psychroserpens sp.]|jgi:hypothetical protein
MKRVACYLGTFGDANLALYCGVAVDAKICYSVLAFDYVKQNRMYLCHSERGIRRNLIFNN